MKVLRAKVLPEEDGSDEVIAIEDGVELVSVTERRGSMALERLNFWYLAAIEVQDSRISIPLIDDEWYHLQEDLEVAEALDDPFAGPQPVVDVVCQGAVRRKNSGAVLAHE